MARLIIDNKTSTLVAVLTGTTTSLYCNANATSYADGVTRFKIPSDSEYTWKINSAVQNKGTWISITSNTTLTVTSPYIKITCNISPSISSNYYTLKINGNKTTSTSVVSGSKVTVSCTVLGASGYEFDHWEIGTTNTKTNPCTLYPSKDTNCIAVLKQKSYSVTFSSGDPSSISVYPSGSKIYTTSISSTASFIGDGAKKYKGFKWERSDGAQTFYTAKITADASDNNKTWKAYGNGIKKYTVSATVDPQNSGTVSGTGSFEYNKSTTLTPEPKTGYKFSMWDDGSTSSSKTISNISSNISVKAYFTGIDYIIKFNSNGGTAKDADGKTIDYSSKSENRKYGDSPIQINIKKPEKVGYDFVCWECNGRQYTYPDNISEYFIYSADCYNGSSPVTLNAVYTPIENKCIFKYYIPTESDYKTINRTYIIEDVEFIQSAPNDAEEVANCAFLGWYLGDKNGPTEPWWINDKGYFSNMKDVNIIYSLPIHILPKQQLTKPEYWGTTTYYYGIWIKSGKYVKVDGNWKKVNTAFIKDHDKGWVVIDPFEVKIDSTWKKEAGF